MTGHQVEIRAVHRHYETVGFNNKKMGQKVSPMQRRRRMHMQIQSLIRVETHKALSIREQGKTNIKQYLGHGRA